MAVATEQSWQLAMFDKSLKKRMKVKHLKRHLGDIQGHKCFMITCGDNNGALNYHVARLGGSWNWAEFQAHGVSHIENFLQQPITWVDPHKVELPFEDGTFDNVVVIDCHEHLRDPVPFTHEIARITRPGGKVVVSVPNGDNGMLGVKIKNLVGMTNEKYGHIVTGYDIPDMSKMLENARLRPVAASSYSKFITEMIELGINFAYVKVFSKKGNFEAEEGAIAPQTEQELKSVGKSYKLYSTVYPMVRTVSGLEALLFFSRGYAVVVSAIKE